MADASVRLARADDVSDIARIQIDTWRTAYAGILSAPVLDALSTDTAVAAWLPAITTPPTPRHHVLVAWERDWRVGFAAVVPAADLEPDDLEPAPDPLRTVVVGPLLVEPRWGRRGHGSRLLAAAVDHAVADGMTAAVAWVPTADAASLSFYRGAGWAADGVTRTLDTGAGELREVRLHVSFGDQAA